MKLQDFINKNYGGSVLEFCRSNGIENTSTVYQWLKAKQPYYVIDGKLYQSKERAIK